MKDQAQTEEAPRIEIGSQTTNDLKIAGQKRGFRVLHVDDDPCILQVSKSILELEGNFEVDTALSVDEAFKKLEEQSYDAVISDYEMPQKNGLQFLKEIRQQKNEIPFVLFTGKGREEVAITALNLGADGYYNKQGSTETVYGELAHGIRSVVSRREAEEDLCESEERFKAIVENAPFGYYRVGKDGLWQYVNPVWERMHGFSFKEVVGKPFEITQPEGSVKQAKELVKRALSGESLTGEFGRLTKEGKIEYHSYNIQPIKHGKEIVAIEGFIRDISERQKAKEALKQERDKLDCIIDSSPIIIAYKDKEGKFIRVNKTFAEAVKMPKEEFLGKTVFDLYSAKIAQGMTNDDSEVLKSGRPKLGIIEQYESASGIRWVQTDKVPIFDENGIPAGLVLFAQDITERKKTEEALLASEEKYRATFESTGTAAAIIEEDTTFSLVNAECEKLSGYSKEELEGKKRWTEFVVKEDLDRMKEKHRLRRIDEKAAPMQYEFRFIDRYGEIKNIILTIAMIPGTKKSVASLLDITEHKKAEEEIARLASFPALNPNPVVEVDLEGDINYANSAAERAFPDLKKAGLNHPFFSGWEQVIAAFKDEKQQTFGRDIKIGDVWFHQQLHVVPETRQLRLYVTNITEAKETEKELRVSEEKYRGLFESTQDGIVISDAEGVVVSANQAAAIMLSYKNAKELVNVPAETLYEDPQDRRVLFELLAKKGNIKDYEVKLKRKDGKTFDVRVTVVLQRDLQGNVLRSETILRDITERKQIEETLRKNEERFRQVSDNAQTWMWEVDSNGVYTYVSSAVEKVLGYKSEEIVGKHFYDLLLPEEREELKKTAAQAFAKKSPFRNLLNRNVHKNGSTVWLSTSGVPIVDEKGNLLGYKGADTDITEYKRMEQTLKESEEKYRRQFMEALDAIFVADAETGILVDCNPAACELVGREKTEIVGMHQRILHPPEKNEGELSRTFKEHLDKKEGLALESQVITKSGEIKDVAIKANIFTLGNKTLMQGSFRDITEQKKVEKALREAEEKYRETIVNANVGIIAYDPKGEVKILNPKMEEMTGFTSREIPTLTKWFEKLYPNEEERRKVRDKWFKRMSEEGEVKEGHAIITTKEGKRRNFLFNGFQLKSGDFTAFAQDITERKEAEEKLGKLMNELVLVNEKLNVVGSLTRHDVRNKLCAVTGNAFLLKKKHADQADILDGLGKMEQACKDIGEIFDFSKIYEQLGVEELTYINIEKTLNEAAALFPDLTIKVVNDCHGLSLLADSFLRQLFYNFIDNTRKYGEKTTATRMYFEKAESDELRLIYEDDGVGISAENKLKLFTEGFSTGGSTGFGLFLSKKMMDVYGWTIQETGEAGKGAKFVITIPKVNQRGKENFQIT